MDKQAILTTQANLTVLGNGDVYLSNGTDTCTIPAGLVDVCAAAAASTSKGTVYDWLKKFWESII